MLKELVKSNKLYGYNADFYSCGKGIVIADSKKDAMHKIKDAYLTYGFSEDELSGLEVWKISQEDFRGSMDVLEIWE